MKDSQGLGGDNLDDKTLTICTGTDFVNLSWTTFVFDSASKATVSLSFFEKLYHSWNCWRTVRTIATEAIVPTVRLLLYYSSRLHGR